MSKLEINNEIVKMRPMVRQARVHTVRKLIREAKTLRGKRGTEKQQEKYKRKADRLTEEVLAAKKIPDDEVSRFAVSNSVGLHEILSDASTDGGTRVTARMSNHKSLVDRVSEFKEKYPNYEDHLGPGRRKLMKLKRKAGKVAKKEAKRLDREQKLGSDGDDDPGNDSAADVSGGHSSEEDKEMEEDEMKHSELPGIVDAIVDSESNRNGLDNDSIRREDSATLEEKEILEAECPQSVQTTGKESKTKKKKNEAKCGEAKSEIESSDKSLKLKVKPVVERNTEIKATKNRPDKTIKAKPQAKGRLLNTVSKEATVKRFTQLLREENAENKLDGSINSKSNESKVEFEKEVDSFFMTGDDEAEYLSVAVPKTNIPEDGENNEDQDIYSMHRGSNYRNTTGNKFERNRGDRFFHNLDKFSAKNENPKWSRNGDKRSRSTEDGAGFEKRPRKEFERKDAIVNEKMHPSWAAKKKQQEVLKQGFQGKKIVFDD